MNIAKKLFRIAPAWALGCFCLVPLAQGSAAEANSAIPSVIEAGLALWVKTGADMALDTWQKGGIMEGNGKIRLLNSYFRQLDHAIGNYRSCELVESKRISQSSRLLYLCLNFQRGAVYARFAVYRTDKDWVVQSMDFSTRPEAIMPGLVFEGVNYTE